MIRDGKIEPVVVEGSALSMGLLVPAQEAVIWRGPMHGAITQFLRDTAWGSTTW